MFNKFAEFINEMSKEGENLFSRVKDKSLFRRVVYSSFLIASADGDFDSSEKSALAKIIGKELPQFKINDILKILGECEEKVSFDKAMGESELIDDIGGASGDDCGLIMRISCYIGAADGDFDADEKAVAIKIAKSMGSDPSRYGL